MTNTSQTDFFHISVSTIKSIIEFIVLRNHVISLSFLLSFTFNKYIGSWECKIDIFIVNFTTRTQGELKQMQ